MREEESATNSVEEEKSANQISLDSLGYIENTSTNDNGEAHMEPAEPEIPATESFEEQEQHTPQLFSEENFNSSKDEEIDHFKQDFESEKEQESLIKEDEEEDLEIPAFLRKQKN